MAIVESAKADFEIGGGWGNSIQWWQPKEFHNIKEGGIFSVYGFKSKPFKIPKIGDTLVGQFQKCWMKFIFIEVKWEDNPKDMFWGKVKVTEQILKEGE